MDVVPTTIPISGVSRQPAKREDHMVVNNGCPSEINPSATNAGSTVLLVGSKPAVGDVERRHWIRETEPTSSTSRIIA
jgi:hypothetical protein